MTVTLLVEIDVCPEPIDGITTTQVIRDAVSYVLDGLAIDEPDIAAMDELVTVRCVEVAGEVEE